MYLTDQLLTYIGNKRALLPLIDQAWTHVRESIAGDLTVLDGFAGSGVVSRWFKTQAVHTLYSNDFEPYSSYINRVYLANEEAVDRQLIAELIAEANALPLVTDGIIQREYAPLDDSNIKPEERCFYTRENAQRIDTIRQWAETQDPLLQPYIIAPLLIKASIHTNTGGVFKGFYKDAATGVGKFGGTRAQALSRICAPILLEAPLWHNSPTQVDCFTQDTNQLVSSLQCDVAYFDPPYNQHPYGSNYHMLNTILTYQPPHEASRVAGIPKNWQRSNYNRSAHALSTLQSLIDDCTANAIIISYNSEGFISYTQMVEMLEDQGECYIWDQNYNTYRASRNLNQRNQHVTEYCFVLYR